MPTLNLASSVLSEIQNVLARVAPQVEVWAYGSRVKNFSHEGSDLDLVIRNVTHLEEKSTLVPVIKRALQESQCPILVDVMDWASLPVTYRQEIEKEYVVIQDV